MNPWLEAFLWSVGVVVGAFGFIANYAAIVDFWERLSADKKAQPMLAVSIVHFSRQQNRANNRYYLPFDVKPGEALDFEQQQQLSFDYEFVWSYDLHITNQTEHTAYKLKVIGVEDRSVSMVVDPKVDYTKPVTANNHKEHRVIYRMPYRCKGSEGEELRAKAPVPKIRIEYSNLAGTRFATDFFFAETDDKKKNVYLKVS